MSKNKKGKVVALNAGQLSPEKYIKTQARTLPIVKCLINRDWEDTGLCNIIIARQHKTGKFTVGLYLVDMHCLGLKDTTFRFNIYSDEFDDFKAGVVAWAECEYALAHNIIYGSIEYADDYGFKPHKDFAVTQYLLEEDDDDIELMDLEFGLDGVPCYTPGPYDDAVKVKNIIATLNRTAGPGNFEVYDDYDDLGDDDFDDDKDPTGLILDLLNKYSTVYDELFRTPEVRKILKDFAIGTKYNLTDEPIENEYNKFDGEVQQEEYYRLHDIVLNGDNLLEGLQEAQMAVIKYPDKPLFYNVLQSAYVLNGEDEKADELILKAYLLFPDYLFAKCAYADLLIDLDKADGVLAVFNGKPDLHYLYPDRKVFHLTEAATYYATMCRYFITMDNLDSADLYMNAILANNLIAVPNQTAVNKAVLELYTAKVAKIKEFEEREQVED